MLRVSSNNNNKLNKNSLSNDASPDGDVNSPTSLLRQSTGDNNARTSSSTSPPAEQQQQQQPQPPKVSITRALPTFCSSPDILTDDDNNDDETLFSEAERKLIQTDSITSTWQNVDNIYIGQLFQNYGSVPLYVRRHETSSDVNNSSDQSDNNNNNNNDTQLLAANQRQQKRVVVIKEGAPDDNNKSTAKESENTGVAADNAQISTPKNAVSKVKVVQAAPIEDEHVGELDDADMSTNAGALILAAQQNEQFDITKCTTDSRIKEERLYARRYRIKASKMADARSANQHMMQENNTDNEPNRLKEQDLPLANAQIERSDKQIFATFEEGETTLTNFTAGARKRYAQRRRYMQNELEKIQIMLEEEHNLFSERYAAILERFNIGRVADAAPHRTAESLELLLEEQRAACGERLELKQRVIQRLQDSLRLVDEHYAKSLKKQELDLVELSDNYKQVFKKLLASFLDETHDVEDVLYEDLNMMKEQCRAQFDAMRGSKYDTEVGVIQQRNGLKDEFDDELEGLRWSEIEKFNGLKKKLENDVHTIEQQLVLMKAGFQMNAEKLDYNFQVLKRRDEENTILKAKQKRRITRLQDLLTKLRERQRKQEQFFEHDVEAYANDCSRLAQQIVDLHNKSKHFQKSDVAQFRNVWLVDELDLRQHVHHLLLIDRVISEQILGLDWQPPDVLWACAEIGPVVAKKWQLKTQKASQEKVTTTSVVVSESDKKKNVSQHKFQLASSAPSNVPGPPQVVQAKLSFSLSHAAAGDVKRLDNLFVDASGHRHIVINAHLNFNGRSRSELVDAFNELNAQRRLDYYQRDKLADTKSGGADELSKISPILLAHLFERIASETGFVVENKIVPLISAMAFDEQKHQKFVKFDAILRALGIGTSQDVLKLVQYFIRNMPENVLKMHTKNDAQKTTKTDGEEISAKISSKKIGILDNNEAAAPSCQETAESKTTSTVNISPNENAVDDEKSETTSDVQIDSVAKGEQKRRLLRPKDLDDRGLTLPLIRTADVAKKSAAQQPAILPNLLKGLTPLQQAKLIKEQQQALARVEADDTNIAAIIQEENELISNATARDSEETKKKSRQKAAMISNKSDNNTTDSVKEEGDDEDAQELTINADKNLLKPPSNDKKKKRKKSKKNKSRSASKKQSKADVVTKIESEHATDMRASDYIDPDAAGSSPEYMRVSEATTEILADPLLNALVPLDGVVGILQQFIDDYQALESERKSPSALDVSNTCRDETCDRPYFERYLALLDLDLRLPIWRVLFGKLHVLYVAMMERIKHRAGHVSQTTRNATMLDNLGALMTSEHAAKLLLPALTTIVGDYKKRQNDENTDTDYSAGKKRKEGKRRIG